LRTCGTEITLTPEQAKALADVLWEDPARGAATVAAQILAEMKLPDHFAHGIDLSEREASAVERALQLHP
jgi:hypothetical protein